jgi:hypothetical protein
MKVSFLKVFFLQKQRDDVIKQSFTIDKVPTGQFLGR